MANEFEMSMMEEIDFFLGQQIKEATNVTSIFQEKYTNKMLKKCHKVDSKPIDTPIGKNLRMRASEYDALVNQTM